jgi:hypothetical protein
MQVLVLSWLSASDRTRGRVPYGLVMLVAVGPGASALSLWRFRRKPLKNKGVDDTVLPPAGGAWESGKRGAAGSTPAWRTE